MTKRAHRRLLDALLDPHPESILEEARKSRRPRRGAKRRITDLLLKPWPDGCAP